MKRGQRWPLETRFWRYVVCGLRPSDCWRWIGAVNSAGYGSILLADRRTMVVHRLSYEMHHGVKLSPDQAVCHSCDVRRCVNPNHLWLGSAADNNRDRHLKGRSRGASHSGAKNPMSKLTDDDVRAIRASKGTLAEVASQFGITVQTVRNIKLRHTWKHVS